jgi:signal transduction histidine kinase
MVHDTEVVAFAVLDIDPTPLLGLLTPPADADRDSPMIRTGLCVATDGEETRATAEGPTCITPVPRSPSDEATLVSSAAAAAVRGERMLSTDVRDDAGNPRVLATRPLPAHGWGLVVSVPTEELLAPVANATWTLAGLLAAVGALAVAAALLLASWLTRPIVALQRATVDLAAGERGIALPARAPTELEDLRRSFEAMSVAVATEQADQEDRYRDLEMLAHAMAHDLKGPLTVTRGMLELLDHDRVANEADRRELVSRSLASTLRMQRLIDDLLTLMRAIGAPIAAEPVAMSEVVRDAVSELGLEEATTIGPLPSVRGQRTLLAQVMVNLLHNAATYHRPGEPARIEVSTGPRRNGLVAVLIDDAGLGIPDHERVAMLETFARGTAADRSSGTGLGLPIAKRVAERHGGSIELDDAPLGGARIRVWLPEATSTDGEVVDGQSGTAVV